jgi:hypothetical protein
MKSMFSIENLSQQCGHTTISPVMVCVIDDAEGAGDGFGEGGEIGRAHV